MISAAAWETNPVASTIKIEAIATDDYVREVLPDTFALWGNERTYERYVEDFASLAKSPYGKRRPFTIGLRDDGRIVCSCKNYEREIRSGSTSLQATGIGAVFTPAHSRGRGYATVMLAALLDAERAAGRDVAFLYSDIHPLFYERLGFSALPSRLITLRAQSLDGGRAGAVPLESTDWAAVRRCFEAMEAARPWALRRTPLVWDWMRARWDAPAPDGSQPVQLVVRRGRAVRAYVIGRRALRADTFVIDDFGFDGEEGRAVLPALLRAGAGDLRRVGGWLPPPLARDALPRGSVRSRKDAIFMIALLSAPARAWWDQCRDATLAARSDPTWSADHV
ncbi:MAG: GNAT family N-acetyltransferase [Candidatus Eremiobacteraeota bacterium]|nr:GNAT family N-acetyltransferase [Candidatus Eremiobacteraeota bacterium]